MVLETKRAIRVSQNNRMFGAVRKNSKNVENVKMKVPLVAKQSEGHEGRRQAGLKGLQQKSGPGDF